MVVYSLLCQRTYSKIMQWVGYTIEKFNRLENEKYAKLSVVTEPGLTSIELRVKSPLSPVV